MRQYKIPLYKNKTDGGTEEAAGHQPHVQGLQGDQVPGQAGHRVPDPRAPQPAAVGKGAGQAAAQAVPVAVARPVREEVQRHGRLEGGQVVEKLI